MSDATDEVRRIDQILQVLGERGSRRGLASYASKTSDWIDTLGDHVSDQAETADPFSSFLAGYFEQITRAVSQATHRMDTRPSALLCCLVSAIYHLGGPMDRLQDGTRRLRESDYVHRLRTFRQILVLIRSTSRGQPASVTLRILGFDLSARIRMIMDQALVGPMTLILQQIEWSIAQLVDPMSRAVRESRCRPIIQLWQALLSWFFSRTNGFIGRARGYVMSVLVRSQRRLRSMINGWASRGMEATEDAAARLGYDPRLLDLLIEIIDLLLRAPHLLRRCRIPIDYNQGPSTDTPRTGTPGREPAPDGPTPDGPAPGDPSPDDPTGPEDGSRGDDQLPSGFEPYDHELIGRIGRMREPDTDYVYLTPENIALLMATELDISESEALDMARGQRCREELGADTEQALKDIGLL